MYATLLAIALSVATVQQPDRPKADSLIDFSVCGYRASDQAIPNVRNVVTVAPVEGDCSQQIQRAIDYAASLTPDSEGRRGAVLLGTGTYRITRPIVIGSSGVVLRGSGEQNTIILKQGFERGAAIYIEGIDNRVAESAVAVTDRFVSPVSGRELTLAQPSGLKAGDKVTITRPSTREWIERLGCTEFGGGESTLGWKPTDADVVWDRTVTAVDGNRIEIDIPATTPIEERYGGAVVARYEWTGRIEESGVENLTIRSECNDWNPKDEDHCWTGVYIASAENCWVRHLRFERLAGSAVTIRPTGSKITVSDCLSIDPVSETGGMRRRTFLTFGQQTLFERCVSEQGINAFAVGYCAAGPNAFVQCDAIETLGASGTIGTWACGVLFDIVNIDGNNLSMRNLGQANNGAGWTTANSVAWQSTAAEIECYSPSTNPNDQIRNFAIGCWAQFSGDGVWAKSNEHVTPRSLFYDQLARRTGVDVTERAALLPVSKEASSSPTIAVAMQLAEEAKSARMTMRQWIESRPLEVSLSTQGCADAAKLKAEPQPNRLPTAKFEVNNNGVITADGAAVVGSSAGVAWWNGGLRQRQIAQASPHITRFVPDCEGRGYTDRIDSVMEELNDRRTAVLEHNYGLWYDRRRDDHERIRRRDGDVWGPLYEQPFARSGTGRAWDGLSKYDLTKANEWYWSRLEEFASAGAQSGIMLWCENFFQHNILEAGAHWVDCPWRPTNNINDTQFPEPVNFAGDKRIFVAEMFYDTLNTTRANLHRNYIWLCLDRLSDCSNVIHSIGKEYTGTEAFTEFWVNTVAAWQRDNHKRVNVALSATKDVQDAILENPTLNPTIDIIDIRYWWRTDQMLYAPEGGKNLAPRQHQRQTKIAGRVGFEEVYQTVTEYRLRYPDKAVTYFTDDYPRMGWAIFMAGGSLASIPVTDKRFLGEAATMHIGEHQSTDYRTLEGESGAIVYITGRCSSVTLNAEAGTYRLCSVDRQTGAIETVAKRIRSNGRVEIATAGAAVLWLTKQQ